MENDGNRLKNDENRLSEPAELILQILRVPFRGRLAAHIHLRGSSYDCRCQNSKNAHVKVEQSLSMPVKISPFNICKHMQNASNTSILLKEIAIQTASHALPSLGAFRENMLRRSGSSRGMAVASKSSYFACFRCRWPLLRACRAWKKP